MKNHCNVVQISLSQLTMWLILPSYAELVILYLLCLTFEFFSFSNIQVTYPSPMNNHSNSFSKNSPKSTNLKIFQSYTKESCKTLEFGIKMFTNLDLFALTKHLID